MGLIDDFLARGQKIEAFTMYRKGKRLVRLDADYSTIPTRYPFTLCIDQAATEEVLRNGLRDRGITVEWGTSLQGMTQDADRVTADLRRGDGTAERVEVAWLAGCDGGHSTVRKALGLQLTGESSETWMIADAQVDTELPPNSIYWVSVGSHSLMMVPMSEPGRFRLLDTAEINYDGDAQRLADRFSAKFTSGFGLRTTVHRPTWVSVFTFQQRMIPRMRVGRCFVSGDAAHVHSPASGQGMNTGIQEAFNLAWKIAMVEGGHFGQELLDSYSAERVPIGQRLLDAAQTATFLVQFKNSMASLMLPVVMGAVRHLTPLRKRMQNQILGGMSGLRISYDDSPLTVAGPPAVSGPVPGQRVTQVSVADGGAPGWAGLLAELRDPRWTLLVAAADQAALEAAEEAAPGCGAWLSVRTVPGPETGAGALPDPDGTLRRSLGLGAGGWLLIRPDGYVAARDGDLSRGSLARALTHLRATRVPVSRS